MERQLQTLGIEYEFIAATDGKELPDSAISALYDVKRSLTYIKEPLRKSEIACAHSHTIAYKKILEEKLPYALVLEDDVILDDRILGVLDENFLKKTTFDWLQLDYPSVGWPFLKEWIRGSLFYTKKNPLFFIYAIIKFPYIFLLSLYESWREYFYRNDPHIVTFARPLYFASAYIVTPSGIHKLLSLSEPILFAADMLPNKARLLKGLKMRAVVPQLVRQDRDTFVSNLI